MLSDGAPVLRIVLDKPDRRLLVNMTCTAAVVIKVEEQPPIGVHPTTKHIRREVVTVCRYLSRYVN